MRAGEKDGKAHVHFLWVFNGLRTVPRLFIFLVISNSDEFRSFCQICVSSSSCRKPFHVLNSHVAG